MVHWFFYYFVQFAPLKLRPYGAIQMCILLLLLLSRTLKQRTISFKKYKMQSERAHFDDFVPGIYIDSWRTQNKTPLSDVRLVPPPGELDETYVPSLILAYSLHYVKTWRRPQIRDCITYCTAVRGGPSHGRGNRKFGEIWTCGFWDMPADSQTQTDRQTNKQTDRYAHRNISHPYRRRSEVRIVRIGLLELWQAEMIKRSSAIAEEPRDALYQLKCCQL